MKKNEMTGKKAGSLLAEWRTRLGLQDWKIDLKWKCKPGDMVLDDAVGCTGFNESTKSALIQIIDPECYEPRSKAFEFDFEETLVHELMHLKVCVLVQDENDLQERMMHQLVDDIAKALVKAKRQQK